MMKLPKSYNQRIFLSLIFCFGVFSFFSQTKEALEIYKAKYPGNNIVHTLRKEFVKIDAIKGKPTINSKITDEFFILTSQGAQMMTEDFIEFSTLEEISNIVAYSLVPTVKNPKKINATDFYTKDADQNGMIFHDGSKETSMIFPGLTEGSLRHLSYENSASEYRFPLGFSFGSSIPIESCVFEIDHDTSIHLIYKDFNFESLEIKFEEKVVKNRRIWKWTLANSPAIKIDNFAPKPSYYFPSVYAQISHINSKTGTTKVLGTLEDLLTWYEETTSPVLEEKLSEDLIQISADLVKNKTTDFEKVKAIYYWVQNNIKYIAFEEGINGYVPRKPSLVYEKRYGDCKDMATLIYSMLKSVNVKAHIAWIGSRDLPFKYTDFPSSIADNHMIAVYFENDVPYFLDATSSFQPIQYPTSFILGKEAFVLKNKHEYQVVNVPILSNMKTQMIDSTYIRVDNRKIKGNVYTKLIGYYNIVMNERFKDVPADKLDEKMSKTMLKGNNSFKLKNAKTENVSEKDKDLIIKYDFEVDNYVTTFENETYINMVLEKNIVSVTEIKEDRKSPFEFDFLSHDQYTVGLEIPADMKVKSIPKNVNYNSDNVDFKIDYTLKDNIIYMSLILDLKSLMVFQKDFSKWNEFIKELRKGISETVVLTKK